ncbi:S-Ena type endospore appendage [Bacillus sp. LL01]|uniref:S-Ena type endospore appendage n=1 Tax=Bacillus sp. LL01 TaxID=1665556 RepID=UPI0018E3F6F5|nr:S-Ena type endospore appendage [Bacillus sp. LL01]
MSVEKVYDWVIVPLQFTRCIDIPITIREVTDKVCGNFEIAATEQSSILWESALPTPLTGSVSLSLRNGSLSDLDLIINGKTIETGDGKQYNLTFSSLSSVGILNNNPLITVRGKYCLTIHYAFLSEHNENLWNCGEGDCYLSNECGNPIPFGEIICKEMGERKNKEIMLPNGDRTVLQKVSLSKQGWIGLTYDGRRQSCVIPFIKVEQVLLCAPEGTNIHCEVTDFSCRISSITELDKCWRIEIFIEICQSVEVTGITTLEIPAR